MSAAHRQISVWTIAGEIKSQAIGDGAMGPWETDHVADSSQTS